MSTEFPPPDPRLAEMIKVLELSPPKHENLHVASGDCPIGGNERGVARGAIDPPFKPEMWPVVERNAYHGVVGDFVRTILPHSEADPAALLIQFLAAVGNAIGRGPYYCVEGDLHFTKLNVLLIGATSAGRKGTSLSRVLQVMEIADPDWSSNRVHSGLASGEGLIHHVRDAVHRLKDGQCEEIDAGVSDKRLLVDAQEFAGVLAVMAKPGNTLSPVIRDAWGHRVLQTLGKTSPEKASGSHIGIIGHITEQELNRMITRTDLANGFANRFLFCKSRRSKKLPHGGSLRDAELDRLGQNTRDAINRARKIGEVSMTKDASQEWAALYNDLDDQLHGLVAEVTNRAAPYILRIAVIYAALDGLAQIDLAHLRAAVAVWQYCEESARQIFGGSSGDPLADTIMSALKEAPGGLTRDEIGKLFSWNKSASEIKSALNSLEKQGLVRSEVLSNRGPGRPTERWFAIRL